MKKKLQGMEPIPQNFLVTFLQTLDGLTSDEIRNFNNNRFVNLLFKNNLDLLFHIFSNFVVLLLTVKLTS